MDEKKTVRLSIMPARGRISIGQSALEALGMPESVLLLVSPEESALFLTVNADRDPRGVKVKQDTKGTMRINSMALCRAILSLLPSPAPKTTIRLRGVVTEHGIRFPLAVPSEGKGGIPT